MAGKDPRRKKLNALLQRENITSQMNDTRWRGLIEELQEAKLPVRYRIKLLTDPDISEWGSAFAHVPASYVELTNVGPVLALEIEWLEIDPIGPRKPSVVDQVITNPIDYSREIVTLLETAKVPFSMNDHLIRIVAHLRRT